MEPAIKEKAWDPSIEEGIRARWTSEGTYAFEPGPGTFTIDTPPPYPSGRPWHIGAAAHYAQIDMIARTARMTGRNVYFPIGIDRNGLPVELYTEKKHGIRMRETDRAEFLGLCREALDDLESEMVETMRLLGLSGDIAGRYRTDSDEYRAFTQSTFIELWRRGLVYLADRPSNYDWASGTTIADAEVAYRDLDSSLVHMRFEEAGGDSHIIIASTRPELLCACGTVIVNEKDERYRSMVGRRVRVPLTGAEVEVRTHHSARMDFGSGAVMVCSYGDQNDVALFRELGLAETVAIGLDGKMTAAAGPYEGLRPKQARARVIADLEEAGLAERVERITHRTPVSERTGNPIEIVPMEEYYLRQVDAVEGLRTLGSKIEFHPPMHRQILHNWLDSVNMDWPISRRRYYGTEIPVWRCKKCSSPHVPEPGRYYRPWAEACPAGACGECGCTEFEGEERTFDTWMDSSVSALFVTRFGRDDEFFGHTYPAAVRPQAKDIVRTWLYYSLLRCEQLTGRAPWGAAWIMGYGLDERGAKMSKSRGNAIDPLPLIRRVGADTFRFWSASETGHGYDFRCGEQKIESTKKFLSKLWNVARFISGFEPHAGARQGGDYWMSADPTETDKWIEAEIYALVEECANGYSEYNFFRPAIAIREFTWNVFAAHYVEMVKRRAQGDGFSDAERDSAIITLNAALAVILRLLAPIAPFITEHVWSTLYAAEGSIHRQKMPKPRSHAHDPGLTAQITEFNSRVWNEKKSRGLSLKDPIDMEIPGPLQGFAADLRAMHNLA